MAVQTKLQVRRDTATNWTSTNPTLASGEVGFETDTLKFKVGNGSTAWTSLKYSQDASLLNGTASITALSTTGDITAGGFLKSTNSSGDEGGQIDLAKATTNTVLTTGVTIDVFQDNVRIFETGGNNRGYFINVAAGANSVGTNLVGGGSAFNGGTITNALIVSNTSGVNTSGTYTSTIATGTAPFVVSSTTQVANLNVATSGSVNATVTGNTSANLVYGSMGDNDQFRIQIGATATNAGFVEIATADDGTEPIHVRQYTGVFTTLARTATILDGSGNTTFPGTVSGTRFISNVAIGTAPFTVASTTQVANLNVAISGSTSNVLGGAAGSLPYQSAANTTTYLARTATNNSTLAFNSSTNAPFWLQPTVSNTYYAATTSAQLAGVVSDETGTGNLVFSTSPTFTTPRLANSTTTATAGLRDFDGTVFYSTTTTTPGKALDVASYYYVSSAQYDIDATTGAFVRSLLGGSNTGITVDAGTTYEYEGLFVITALFVATSQTPTINLNSTTVTLSPVVAHQTVVESGNNATGLGSASALSAYRFTSTGIALTALTANSRFYTVKMRGRIAVTGTGTAEIQPTIRFSQGSTDNEWTVEPGAIFRMTPIGNGTVTTVGTWA